MKKMLKVYLAGPMTNCSERQKTVWRNRMKDALRSKFKCIDPTNAEAPKGVLAVSAHIEEADIVIANMWRESIGTTIGILQAKRMGIPVILIDQHCMDSPVLNGIVGKDFIVHSGEAAINKLQNEIAPNLTREFSVLKRNGAVVPFDMKKLQKSLKAACLKAGVDDPIFHILLSRRVQRAIATTAEASPIKTETIRERVFQELINISNGSFEDGDAKLIEHANALREAWEYEELVKEQVRDDRKNELEFIAQVEELSGQVSDLQLEVENLRARLAVQTEVTKPNATPALQQSSTAPVDVLRKHLGRKRALCVGRIGKTSFASAFARRGIQEKEFAELFEEMALEGKQSNLNADLKGYVKSYPFVLYAFDGLRHLCDSLRDTPNLIVGAGPNDAVQRFLILVSQLASK